MAYHQKQVIQRVINSKRRRDVTDIKSAIQHYHCTGQHSHIITTEVHTSAQIDLEQVQVQAVLA